MPQYFDEVIAVPTRVIFESVSRLFFADRLAAIVAAAEADGCPIISFLGIRPFEERPTATLTEELLERATLEEACAAAAKRLAEFHAFRIHHGSEGIETIRCISLYGKAPQRRG